jgi:hypothetical protein
VVEGLVLLLLGAVLIVVMMIVLRSERLRDRLYRGYSSFRALLRLRPSEPQTFVRQFEVGVYFGMCFGVTLALFGLLVVIT